MILASLGTSDWLMPKNFKKVLDEADLAQNLKINLKKLYRAAVSTTAKTRQDFCLNQQIMPDRNIYADESLFAAKKFGSPEKCAH